MANPQPTDAHIRIAHSINEAVMLRDFTKRQRKILDLILRLSWGCGKKDAYIPHQNDFCIVGIYEPDIKAELNWLEQSKIIVHQGMFYWFNKDFDQWQISRVKPFQPDKLSKLLSINLNGDRPKLSKTRTEDLVKHEVKTSQNTKSITPTLASPKERVKKDIKKDIYIPDYINKELWNDFLDMREKIKSPPTEKAKLLLIIKLEQLKIEGDNPNEVISQSIMNNWKGLFPLNKKGGSIGTHKQDSTKIPQTYTKPPPDPALDALVEAARQRGEFS